MAVANRAGAFDIDSRIEWYFGNDAGTTQGGEVETLRLVASAPEATPTPMPTPAPTRPPMPEPTPSPHAGRATVNIHALQTKVQLGEPVVLTLTADNSAGGPQMTRETGVNRSIGLVGKRRRIQRNLFRHLYRNLHGSCRRHPVNHVGPAGQ